MPSPKPRAYLPDLLFAGGRVIEGAALSVEDGVVRSVGAPTPGQEIVRLRGKAILPGLVSAHSHAFQRAIRGRTEHRGLGHEKDDFWSWREAMYAAAEQLSPDDLYAVSRLCFLEMAQAGVTCVGEFHYLHRDPKGARYADANELDKQVIRAAREVGLRVAHLRVAYARAGFGAPENPRQRRFIEPSADDYLANLSELAGDLRRDPLVTVGAAPHSVRACPAGWIGAIAAEAGRRGWPLHLHVSEQPGEVEQCKAEHGVTPPLLLESLGALGERTTAVHAVHLDAADVAALGRARVSVCACPTTERNLGDGVVRAGELLEAGARLCFGTDSNVQIDPLEDARELEYHLRLTRLERAVLDPRSGEVGALGARLYLMASEGGMRALGLPGGALAPGEPADFLVADLGDASIAGAGADDLMAAATFSMARTAVLETYVAGRPLPAHAGDLDGEAVRAFREAMRRLWGGAR